VRRFVAHVGVTVSATMMLVTGCASGREPDGRRSPTPATGAAPQPEPFRCPEQGVVIEAGASDAAMGLRVQSIEIVNCGTVPFTVNGYPGLSVLDAHGDPLNIEIIHGTSAIAHIDNFDTKPSPLTLQPGQRAVAGLVWRNLVTDSTVPAENGEQLAVAPAIGDPWQIINPHGPVDLGNTGRVGVTAWGPARPA
jgi:hypothetical protein